MSAPVVLCVDDEPRILSALRRSLRREGYELLFADSPAAALEVFADRRVDVLLTDHKMRGATGIDLIREVAARFPATSRILITGWTGELDAAELARLEVRAVITKPWDDGDLKSHIRGCLPAGGLGG
ncbi:MAG: response regulator [Myxococcales bacterium]|nr:response regulator [Myxococcales bacterium]